MTIPVVYKLSEPRSALATRILDRLVTGMMYLGAVALVLIMLLAIADIVWRGIGHRSIAIVFPGSELLLVISAFLVIPAAFREGAHVRFELGMNKVPARIAKHLEALGLLISVFVVAWCAWSSYGAAYKSYQTGEYRPATFILELWPGRGVVAIGFTVLLYLLVRRAASLMRSQKIDEEDDDSRQALP